MIDTLRKNQELFDLFTRKEEYSPLFLDKHQRFPYYLSKHRSVFEPKVSEFLVKNGLRIEYPERKRFAVCLTHDIDNVRFSRKEVCLYLGSGIARGELSASLKMTPGLFRNRKLLNFEDIMKLEEKYGAKSSFYFKALGKLDDDFTYKIGDLKNELGDICDKGWEIGLHGGHRAYNNLETLNVEKSRLENVLGGKVIGYRNHFLHFQTPLTWELLNSAGFEYDTTFSYPDVVGFRNGMCHPFRPFNLNTEKEINILEIPLTISDDLLSEKYMKLDERAALGVVKMLIDTVEKLNGVITILWHNTSFFDKKTARMLSCDVCSNKTFYEKILNYCYERNAWITSCGELCKFWVNNQ